jgi:hypothetical protein
MSRRVAENAAKSTILSCDLTIATARVQTMAADELPAKRCFKTGRGASLIVDFAWLSRSLGSLGARGAGQ